MQDRRILESWKEISDYLKRSPKTCMRWEIELGLPIHRLDGTPKARVFAYPDELDRWVKEKLSRTKTEARESVLTFRLKKKKLAIIAAAAIVLAVAAGLGWRHFLHQPVSFPSDNLPSVLFLPFENVTGDETLEPWRSALPHLFFIEFAQSLTAGCSEPWSALKKLGLMEAPSFSAEDVRKIGESVPAEYIAKGSLIKSGQEVIINLSLHDRRTGEVIQSFREISRGERGIFSEIDKLTRKIKLAMGVPARLVSRDIDEEVRQITTSSPEALKSYWEGIRLDMEGKVEEAVALYRKATEIDPEFAEAYGHLFSASEALHSCCGTPWAREEAIRAGKKAFEFSDRLNVWSRANLIGDYYLNFDKNLDMAVVEYKKLIALSGEDPIVALQLAQIYYDLEEYEKIVALLGSKRMLKDSRNARLLANSYARTGEYAKAEKIFDDYISRPSAQIWNLLYAREIIALELKKFDEAFAYNDRLLSLGRQITVQGSRAPIFITQDDLGGAEIELQMVIAEGSQREKFNALSSLAGLYLVRGKMEEAGHAAGLAIEAANSLWYWPAMKKAHFLMAFIERLKGNLPEALREAEMACPCYAQDDAIVDEEKKERIVFKIEDIYCLRYFHQRALISLELGRMEDFESQAAEIKQIIDKGQRPKLIRIYYHLLGHRELREKNFERAIDYFWKALNQLPSPYGHPADIDTVQYYDSLAGAYYQAGKRWSALDLYEKIPWHWEQKLSAADVYARNFYRIAKIYDQGRRPPGTPENQLEADKALAVENYRKFLSLWEDADPIFAPEVEEARARLDAL